MASPRRREDSEEEDYSKVRGGGGPFNGHTKWIVGSVGTLILLGLTTLAARDRAAIDAQQLESKNRIQALEVAMSKLAEAQAANSEWRVFINTTLQEIKADVKDVKKEIGR